MQNYEEIARDLPPSRWMRVKDSQRRERMASCVHLRNPMLRGYYADIEDGRVYVMRAVKRAGRKIHESYGICFESKGQMMSSFYPGVEQFSKKIYDGIKDFRTKKATSGTGIPSGNISPASFVSSLFS